MASIKTIFTSIANAIRTKKGTTDKYLPENMASEVLSIETGIDTSDATATSSDILLNKTAYVNGEKITGSIPTITQATPSISISSSGLITSTSTQSESGYMVSGNKSATKQLMTKGATTYTPTTIDRIISSGLYLTGTITIKGDSSLLPSNIKKGETIFGVAGTYEGESGGDTTQEDGLITGEGTSYTNDRVTKVGQYVFYKSNLTTVNISNATSIESYAFQYCKNLISINLPKATSISNQAFANCTKLAGVDFPNATSIGNQVFEYCSNLTSVSLPKVTNIGSDAFFYCSSLISVNISKVTSIGKDAFYYCYSLMKVIITQTDSICTLLSSTVFNGCYHILGTTNSKYNPTGAKDGYIYVPDALVSSYKTATNWSTYASQIKPLSNLYTWVAASQSFNASMNVGFNVNGQTYFGTTQIYSIDLGPGAKNISLSSSTSSAFVSNLADYSYNSTTGILTINKLYNQYPTTATITINYNKRKLDI